MLFSDGWKCNNFEVAPKYFMVAILNLLFDLKRGFYLIIWNTFFLYYVKSLFGGLPESSFSVI